MLTSFEIIISPVQVVHDCRNDSAALYFQYDVSIKNVFDTQASQITNIKYLHKKCCLSLMRVNTPSEHSSENSQHDLKSVIACLSAAVMSPDNSVQIQLEQQCWFCLLCFISLFCCFTGVKNLAEHLRTMKFPSLVAGGETKN